MSKTLNRRAILAGAAAATVPAAAACIAGDTNPDAELLELGAQLETVASGWATVEEDAELDALAHRQNDLTYEILDLTATTLAGLAVQIRAVTIMAAEIWTVEDCDAPHERAFIEAVCRFAGVPVPELRLSSDRQGGVRS
jgi:hypothetical protein